MIADAERASTQWMPFIDLSDAARHWTIMPPDEETALIQALEDTFVQAGAQGYLHATALDGDQEVAYHADTPVVLASVFKIPVLLELARQAAAGRLDLSERVRVGADARTEGPTGISAMLDEIELSLRDLAFLMISVSDNAATDVLVRRLGVDAINGMLRELGCGRTVIEGDCQYLIDTVHEDLGIPATADLDAMSGGLDPARIAACRALRPEVTNRSTPSDMTRLLCFGVARRGGSGQRLRRGTPDLGTSGVASWSV